MPPPQPLLEKPCRRPAAWTSDAPPRAPERQAPVCYALSVIPALWAFFMAGGGPVSAGMNLVFGYLGLLALDWQFWRWRLAPDWWMRLRLPMTLAVVACLLAGTLL